ncbi:MAG TPA: succinate dehydrogenase cytochrome b subunit [Ferruginibacter sp.]|jgi:succinate dehydrogenase / fumarate reductase cytochrome b subunit|nr:succinate dehydrogenase [Chitinophagaceae bacterium]HML58218.1 succinate dehydrogenase cytochrome b subunit [Ferruginibacter sp.]HRN91063.1 succinate dehydrogenase cytochrome b subunit [Ferruginibacter sp.]HRO05756.1 succinate dehydrogenase cytochrome b subunit [Ferruginibacter sp.]HRO95950.1 succinate dehydrogenase cytochrome b subunit [Ferruginibacter sp.]
MTWKQFFSASIGKKFTVALTGIFLILFLIVHAGVNSAIFVGREDFNNIAHFMSHNYIVRILEIGLFVGIFLHIIQALIVWRQNAAARPVGYHMSKANKNSTWYSRSMGLLGTLILLFLIMHMSHFFVGTKVALYLEDDAPHDLYEKMREVFSNGYIVIIYLVSLVALFWHLMHGFQSAFQTLGLNHKRFTPMIKAIGTGYTIIITLLFASMPLAFYFKWIE